MIDKEIQVCLDEAEDVKGLKEDNNHLMEDLIKTRHHLNKAAEGLESQKIVSKTYYEAIKSIEGTQESLFAERVKAVIVLTLSFLFFHMSL